MATEPVKPVVPPVATSAPVVPTTTEPAKEAAPVVPKQYPQPSQLEKEGLIARLENRASDWIEENKGKTNHNPFLKVGQMIQPMIDRLKNPEFVMTEEFVKRMESLPELCPVLNPDYVPDPEAPTIITGNRGLRLPKK